MVYIALKEIRAQKNLSQRDVAQIAGVPNSLVEKIDSGYANPTITTVCKIADSLDVSLDEFVPKKDRR